ncbi:MAG: CDP-alcohol phosphatidyltransferase family protein [Proteobacteria bacterium]|nr:CDP-alcohol phosphatidyltransferase family protein [Pseudomonadota bacterium]
MTQSPWDQRLARILVRPLASTPVQPNHLTAFSLASGLASGALFAFGGAGGAGWAAAVFMLAVLIDHTDGELARLTAKTSEFGHRFDYIVGAANYTALFIGIGAGLYAQGLGVWALILGLAAGLSNPVICALRLGLEDRHGAGAVEHPSFGGFEIEDFIYLIGPITWIGGLSYFFLAYGLGTLGYLGWTLWQVIGRARRASKPAPGEDPQT